MRIGELARRTGTTTRALRYYEKQGLLSPVRRRNGYRTYQESDVVRVEGIRRLLALGFSSDVILPFLKCGDDFGMSGEPVCRQWVDTAQCRLAEMDRRLGELQAVRDRLADAIRRRKTELPALAPSPRSG